MQDCSHALAALPRADGFYSWYFEQQLETAPPESDWRGWTDNRPIAFRKKVVQVPKFWNHGKQACLRTSYINPIMGAFDTGRRHTEDTLQGRAISPS